MIRNSPLVVAGLIMTAVAAFTGCSPNVNISGVVLSTTVLNCTGSKEGIVNLEVLTEGPSSAMGEWGPDAEPISLVNGNMFHDPRLIQASSGRAQNVPFGLVYGSPGSTAYWFQADQLKLHSLNYMPVGGVFAGQTINPTLESVDFSTATGSVTFDCNNPNPSGGDAQAQLDKLILKRIFRDLKGSVRSVLPEAIANGDLKTDSLNPAPFREGHEESAYSKKIGI